MQSTKDRIAEIRAKVAKDIERAERDEATLIKLGGVANGYHSVRPHNGCYGARWVNFGRCDYESIRDGKNPDAALVKALLDKIPPSGAVIVRDGCVSIKPATGDGEGQPIAPVWVRIEPESYSNKTAVQWYGDLDGELVRVAVEFGLRDLSIGTLDIVTRTHPQTGTRLEVERCDFRPSHSAGERIKWASGDRNTLNDFSVYWTDEPEPGEWLARLGLAASGQAK